MTTERTVESIQQRLATPHVLATTAQALKPETLLQPPSARTPDDPDARLALTSAEIYSGAWLPCKRVAECCFVAHPGLRFGLPLRSPSEPKQQCRRARFARPGGSALVTAVSSSGKSLLPLDQRASERLA
jgi:hypothetical protein